MSTPCFRCGYSLEHSWSTCPNCKLIESQERSAQSIIDANKRANDQAESDRFWDNVYAERAQAEQRSAILSAIQSAQDKLEEMRQESITDAAAKKEGKKFTFLNQFPNACEGSLDEYGEIKNLFFDSPYKLQRLNDAYNQGVFDRVYKQLGNSYRIPNAESDFLDQALYAGQQGWTSFKFGLKVESLSDLNFSTQTYSAKFSIDTKTGVVTQTVFPAFTRNDLQEQYALGVAEFLETANHPDEKAKNVIRFKQERKEAVIQALKELIAILMANSTFKLVLYVVIGLVIAHIFGII